MTNIQMINKAKINEEYEFLQIIKDFDDARQIFREAFQNSYDNSADIVICKVYTVPTFGGEDLIIDIIDNGLGLEKEKIHHFFNLADSTKVDENLMKKKDTLGYKGHGAKIFFNSERVLIASKSLLDTSETKTWAAVCENPIKQLRENKELRYSGILNLDELGIKFPDEIKDSGFFLRIVNPIYFRSKTNWYKLNHLALRDYIKWFTVFGSIKPIIDKNSHFNQKLYLRGLGFGNFRHEYEFKSNIEPKLEFIDVNRDKMEVIKLGHYFPDECSIKKQLQIAANQANMGKNPTDYYSHFLSSIPMPIICESTVKFNLLINLEGYETKRKYNLCLQSRSNQSNDKMHYTDDTIYGLWACKDGVPIERIDGWIGGKKYTYMHGFLDCDRFELTANRGSIRVTENEVIDSIKDKLAEILGSASVSKEFKEREEEERIEKREIKAEIDKENLLRRFRRSQNRHKIIFPDGSELMAPGKNINGRDYSESETMVLLIQLINKFPDLFNFNILDYNTVDGIDFLVIHNNSPKYIELKGSLKCNINHSFKVVSKFICYTISSEIKNDSILSDSEENIATFKVCKNDHFISTNPTYNGSNYTGYKIEPQTSGIDSMQVIALDKVVTEILGARIE